VHAERPAGTPAPLTAWRLDRAIAYMERNFASDILVNDIASAAGLSPFYFSRTFCAATGRSPHAYLIQLRMAEAQRLLHDTALPVADIAKRVGYRTHAHFTNVFREQTHMTPLVYRRRSRLS
jgi:AraC family transcriptional regulator